MLAFGCVSNWSWFRAPVACGFDTPRCSIRLAFVREVPSTLASGLLAPGMKPADIYVQTAKAQHEAYVALLREQVGEVFVLPVSNECPDSVFIEDAAVVYGSRALQGVAGHPTRAAEAALLAPELHAQGLEVVTANARLDGGDVLLAGDMFFVGMSKRTGPEAVTALKNAFNREVIPIDVQGGQLHLKCVVTWVKKANSFIFEDSVAGRDAYRQICEKTGTNWDVIWVPRIAKFAANVLDLGDCVLLQERFWDDLVEVREKLLLRGILPKPCDMSELAKANGALTCCSILVSS